MIVTQDIVHALNQQDAAAFKVVYGAFYNRVYVTARYYVGDALAAEDLTADAFMKVWINHHYNDADHILFSLLSMVKTMAITYLQSISKEHELKKAIAAQFEIAASELEDQAAQDARMLDLIDQEAERLPRRLKEYFTLYRKGYKPQEISAIMQLKPDSVYTMKQHLLHIFEKVILSHRTTTLLGLVSALLG